MHEGKKSWKGLEINSFFGKPENLEIELEGGVDEGITEAQQKAYGNVRNNMDFMSIFESKCERMIFRIQHFAFRIEFVIFAK